MNPTTSRKPKGRGIALLALPLCLVLGCGGGGDTAQLRIAHGLHGTGIVSVRIDGRVVIRNSVEAALSKYSRTDASEDASIEVDAADGHPLAKTRASLVPNSRYTMELTGSTNQPVLQVHDVLDGYFRVINDSSVNPLLVSVFLLPDRKLVDISRQVSGGILLLKPPPEEVSFLVEFSDSHNKVLRDLEFSSIANLSILVTDGPDATVVFRTFGSDDSSLDL